jgi:hypothetical protein
VPPPSNALPVVAYRLGMITLAQEPKRVDLIMLRMRGSITSRGLTWSACRGARGGRAGVVAVA